MTTNPQGQTDQELKKLEFQFEIVKLEYEQTTERYENIYKAIWQIFSYMSALAVAIVAFGANNLSSLVVVFIAPLPLLFWFLAIYIPMDFYGNQSRKRLAEIEEGINAEFLKDAPVKLKLNHFRDFNRQAKTHWNRSPSRCLNWLNNLWQSKHLRWLNNLWQRLNNPWQTRWRVRHAIFTFAGVAVLAWIVSFTTLTNSSQLKSKYSRMEIKLEPPVQVLTQDSQLQELKKELLELFDKKLDEKLDPIRSLISEKNLNLNNNVGKAQQ